MSSNHSVEDVVQDQQQTPIDEQLPAYSEATKDQSLVKVFEKDPPRQQKLKASSKMSTFRSILNGDVHKHNPRYVLEESITGRPSAARSKSIATTKTSPSSSSTTSTFKSILSGLSHVSLRSTPRN